MDWMSLSSYLHLRFWLHQTVDYQIKIEINPVCCVTQKFEILVAEYLETNDLVCVTL